MYRTVYVCLYVFFMCNVLQCRARENQPTSVIIIDLRAVLIFSLPWLNLTTAQNINKHVNIFNLRSPWDRSKHIYACQYVQSTFTIFQWLGFTHKCTTGFYLYNYFIFYTNMHWNRTFTHVVRERNFFLFQSYINTSLIK